MVERDWKIQKRKPFGHMLSCWFLSHTHNTTYFTSWALLPIFPPETIFDSTMWPHDWEREREVKLWPLSLA